MINTEKQLKTLNILFGIAAGLWGIWSVYIIVRNIQRPAISVKSVDYGKGEAVIIHKGQEEVLYKNSTISVGADGSDWGVRFNGQTEDTANRIELINNELVYQTLHKLD